MIVIRQRLEKEATTNSDGLINYLTIAAQWIQ